MKLHCSWIFLILRRFLKLIKKVNIKTHGQERIHITAILWIVADDAKILPMLVYKGQPNGRVERGLHKNLLVNDKRYLLIANLRHGTIWQ